MVTRLVSIEAGDFLLGAATASGEALEHVLDAGQTALDAAAADIGGDMDLVTGGSLDVLPRSGAARLAMEAARSAAHAGDIAHSADAARHAIVGALADQALEAMKAEGHAGAAFAVSGECGAFSIGMEDVLDVPANARGSLWLEVVRGLRPAVIKGGIAVTGARIPQARVGDGDAVAIYAPSAADAALSAVLVGEAIRMRPEALKQPIPPAEEIWDALSRGVRVLLPLREANMVRAGVLALRGRGRLIGPIAGDRILRFGVSDWR